MNCPCRNVIMYMDNIMVSAYAGTMKVFNGTVLFDTCNKALNALVDAYNERALKHFQVVTAGVTEHFSGYVNYIDVANLKCELIITYTAIGE